MPAERDARVELAGGVTLACSIASADHAGDRPAIVLIHGLASNRSRWREFVANTTLTRHFDVLRIDLRGHGDSVGPGALTIERWCDDLRALLDALALRRAIIVGHSLGAQVALAFAARFAVSCAGVVLIDPVLRAAARGKWRTVAAFASLFALIAKMVRGLNAIGLRRRVVVPFDLTTLDALARVALQSKSAEADFVRRYSSMRADLEHFRTANYLDDLAQMARRAPALASIGVPVLAVLSTGGTFAPLDVTERLLRQIARATIVRIECHHWPLTEKPTEVRTAIERWCETLPVT